MKLNISLSSTTVLFEFDTPRDRDTFWKGMEKSGFAAQGASQRMGTRGINIVTAKIKTPYAWPFEALPSPANGSVPVTQVANKVEAPAPVVTAPIPVPPAVEPPPDIPIPQLTEVPIPTATTEAPPIAAPAATTTTPPKAVVDDPEPTGIHKNSRKFREWKARQAK